MHSCSRCITSSKGTLFPVVDEGNRAHNHKLSKHYEEPIIFNPCIDNPEEHLTFHKEIIAPIADRGHKNIEILGLNRDDLNSERECSYADFETMTTIYELVKGTTQEDAVKAKLIGRLKQRSTEGKYTLMFKCILK